MDIFTLYALLNAIQPDFEKKNRALLNKIKKSHHSSPMWLRVWLLDVRRVIAHILLNDFATHSSKIVKRLVILKNKHTNFITYTHKNTHKCAYSTRQQADQTHKPKARMQKKA